MSENIVHQERLNEVTLLHCVLAILIVFMHSFTFYNGGWPEPSGYAYVPVYKWLARFSYASTLETFVFVSGYLLSFQLKQKNKFTGGLMVGGKKMIANKLKRLLLPSVLFSIPYYIFFARENPTGMVYSIISGTGHMWFLPMLFWCFFFSWILINIKCNDVFKLLILACLYLFHPSFSFIFQMGRVPDYLFFFYSGYVMYKYRDTIKEMNDYRKIILAWCIFIILFVGWNVFKDHPQLLPGILNTKSYWFIAAYNKFSILYKSAGLLALYLTAIEITSKYQVGRFVMIFAANSFGVYIIQQFALQFLYYKTDMPIIVGPYWLPWFGFIIALSVSLFGSIYLRKLRIGRFLLG